MGTVVSFDLRAGAFPDDAVAAACRRLHDADATFSPYREDSSVRRIDRAELSPSAAGRDVRHVLTECARLRVLTGGYFDERARGVLDPSAYVKGWATERAAAELIAHGVEDFCLTAGGDVVTRGCPAPDAVWRVGVQHPLDPRAIAAVVAVQDGAVATSGLYERDGHILDPVTGEVPADVLSVTVTGPDLAVADALSTAAFARGAAAPGWTLSLPDGYAAMTITADERVVTTPGFPSV